MTLQRQHVKWKEPQELKHYRTIDAVREKWEAREDRLWRLSGWEWCCRCSNNNCPAARKL